MAGKRMKLSMSMNLFSYNPVYGSTIDNWVGAVRDVESLKAEIRNKIKMWYTDPLDIETPNAVLIKSLIELFNDIDPETEKVYRIKLTDRFIFDYVEQSRIDTINVEDAAQTDDPERGVWLLLLLCTWRTFIQKMVGPIPGVNFNITIAGCVATCMRLGIEVELT
jgi:hypothetical protein